jgi:hypothetical protein
MSGQNLIAHIAKNARGAVTALGLVVLGLAVGCAVAAWRRRSLALVSVALLLFAGACWPWGGGGDDTRDDTRAARSELLARGRAAEAAQVDALARFESAPDAAERAAAETDLDAARAEIDAVRAAAADLPRDDGTSATTTARESVSVILAALGAFGLGAACARWRARRAHEPAVAWPSIFANQPPNPAPPMIDRSETKDDGVDIDLTHDEELHRRTRPPILQPASRDPRHRT